MVQETGWDWRGLSSSRARPPLRCWSLGPIAAGPLLDVAGRRQPAVPSAPFEGRARRRPAVGLSPIPTTCWRAAERADGPDVRSSTRRRWGSRLRLRPAGGYRRASAPSSSCARCWATAPPRWGRGSMTSEASVNSTSSGRGRRWSPPRRGPTRPGVPDCPPSAPCWRSSARPSNTGTVNGGARADTADASMRVPPSRSNTRAAPRSPSSSRRWGSGARAAASAWSRPGPTASRPSPTT